MGHALVEWLRAIIAAFLVSLITEAAKAARRLFRRRRSRLPKATPIFIGPRAEARASAAAVVSVPAPIRATAVASCSASVLVTAPALISPAAQARTSASLSLGTASR